MCENCKHSYKIKELNFIGCNIVNKDNNIALKTLGEENKCPFFMDNK